MLKEQIRTVYGGEIRLRVMGVLSQDSKILLVKHKGLGRDFLLSPPGGGVQYSETLEQALVREYYEETHLTISVANFITLTEFIDLPLHAVELIFAVRYVRGILEKGQEPELATDILTQVAFTLIKIYKRFILLIYINIFIILNFNGFQITFISLQAKCSIGISCRVGTGGHILVSIVDNIMIGFIGTLPLAASSFANSICSIFLVLIIGFSFGSTTLMGQSVGEQNMYRLTRFFKNTLLTNFLFVTLLVSIILGLSPLMYHMGQTNAVASMAIPYFKILIYGLLPYIFFLSFKSLSESLSLTKIIMIITLAGNVLNIILNYILIYGKLSVPAMGLLGAGYATSIARLAMALGLGLYIFYSKYFEPVRKHFKTVSFTKPFMKKITVMSLPISAQFTMEVVAFSMGGIMVGWISEKALAAHQIALTLAAFTYMLATGLSVGNTIRVSHQFGKKNYSLMKQVGRSFQEMTLFFMMFWAYIFIVFNNQLPLWFIDDQEVITIAAELLLVAAVFQVFDGLQTVSLAALRGIGDVNRPTIIALISYFIVGIPAGYCLTFTFGMGLSVFGLGMCSLCCWHL